MKCKMIVLGALITIFVSILWAPSNAYAAECEEANVEACIDGECNSDIMLNGMENILLHSARVAPVCNHDDPTNPRVENSSMRYVRTVQYYNVMESRYDTRDYYVCVVCGYERFFVHN